MSTNKGKKKAVALKYDKESGGPPVITASGYGKVAEKIIKIAQENKIPLQEDSTLVEALSRLDIGQEIPSELYEAVAVVLAYVLKTDEELS